MLQLLTRVAADINSGDIGIPKVPLNNDALANLLSIAFLAVGGLSTLFLLIGAARYVGSGGEPKNTKQAKDTIMYAIIGLAVSLTAFTIVQFVLGKLTGTL